MTPQEVRHVYITGLKDRFDYGGGVCGPLLADTLELFIRSLQTNRGRRERQVYNNNYGHSIILLYLQTMVD